MSSPTPKPWDSYFVWMLVGFLVAVMPFLMLAAFFDLQRWPSWLAATTAVGLICMLALTSWLIARPVLNLSSAAAGVESGDLSSRAVPSGGGDTRRLAMTFNVLLDRLGSELPRLRGEASESAIRLSASAGLLAMATGEQSQAAAETTAELEALANTASAQASIAADLAARGWDQGRSD